MKRVEINEIQFKKMIDGVKYCVACDNSRPVLKYILIKVKSDTITAYALDGYRAGRVEIKNDYPIDEEFTCFIKPFTVKVSKNGVCPVIIEQSDKKTFVEVVTEYGVLRYGFNIPTDKFPDIEKVYSVARSHDRELGMQPRFIIDAMKSLKGISAERTDYVIFESKENNKEAFIIRSAGKDIVNEQLILPVRLMEKK